MGGDELQRLTSIENLNLGMVAGMACKAINYPLLHWKNKAQQSKPISFNPTVVYRGLPMAMVNLGGTTAVQFGLTGFFQKLFAGESNGKKLPREMEMLSAFLGGFISGIPCGMWELTMVQQQGKGGSIIGTPARIIKAYGAPMMLRGVTMTMGRESLYNMGMLGITPIVQRMLIEDYKIETSVALAAGSLIGAVTSVMITHPMDTIKTCMQGDIERETYGTVTETAQVLIRDKGGIVQGLFKGVAWRIALISTTFFLVNKLKLGLAPIMFPV